MSGHRDRHSAEDDALTAALRACVPAPPLDEVDWEHLHRRLVADAEPRLAALRRRDRTAARPRWWDVVAAWAARGIPLTATAAGAAALVLALGGPRAEEPEPAGGTAIQPAPAPVADALAVDAGPLLTGDDPEDVLVSAILYDETEW